MLVVETNEILDRPISLEEVCNLSKRLKNKKASANDLLSYEIIKLAVEDIPSYFQKLFNIILSYGHFPSLWSKGFIVSIQKSGSNIYPNNYRGIRISSCLEKFFTFIMLNVRMIICRKRILLVTAKLDAYPKVSLLNNLFSHNYA